MGFRIWKSAAIWSATPGCRTCRVDSQGSSQDGNHEQGSSSCNLRYGALWGPSGSLPPYSCLNMFSAGIATTPFSLLTPSSLNRSSPTKTIQNTLQCSNPPRRCMCVSPGHVSNLPICTFPAQCFQPSTCPSHAPSSHADKPMIQQHEPTVQPHAPMIQRTLTATRSGRPSGPRISAACTCATLPDASGRGSNHVNSSSAVGQHTCGAPDHVVRLQANVSQHASSTVGTVRLAAPACA